MPIRHSNTPIMPLIKTINIVSSSNDGDNSTLSEETRIVAVDVILVVKPVLPSSIVGRTLGFDVGITDG